MTPTTRFTRMAGAALSLFLGVLGGATRAADIGAGAAPEGVDPLDAFVRQLGDEQRARVAPIVQAAGTNAGIRATALLEGLLALNPDLVQALGSLDDGRPADALPALERLGGSTDGFLATHAAWFRVRALIGVERYEDAAAALTAMQPNATRYTQSAEEMAYTEGLLRVYLLERPAAAAALRRYLEQFPQAPADRRGTARRMLDEIEYGKTNSLPEVVTLMDESRRRLRLNDSGDLTQTRQRQIVQVLDALIAELEKKQGGGGSGSGKGSGQGGGRGGSSGGRGGGAKESSLAGGASGTQLARPVDAGNADEWARAYARDREAVQRELQARMPERYRELIEQYYRSLSADDAVKEDGQK